MKRGEERQEAREAMDQGLSRREAATLLGVQPSLLANWAVFGRGPAFRKLAPGKRGKVVYLRSEVLAWLKSRPMHGGGAA